jgi:hypothetical protein
MSARLCQPQLLSPSEYSRSGDMNGAVRLTAAFNSPRSELNGARICRTRQPSAHALVALFHPLRLRFCSVSNPTVFSTLKCPDLCVSYVPVGDFQPQWRLHSVLEELVSLRASQHAIARPCTVTTQSTRTLHPVFQPRTLVECFATNPSTIEPSTNGNATYPVQESITTRAGCHLYTNLLSTCPDFLWQ